MFSNFKSFFHSNFETFESSDIHKCENAFYSIQNHATFNLNSSKIKFKCHVGRPIKFEKQPRTNHANFQHNK